MRVSKKALILMFVLGVSLVGSSSSGSAKNTQPPNFVSLGNSLPAVRDIAWPEDVSDDVREIIYIIRGTSQVFRFDRPITRISLSGSDICDVLPINASQFIMNSQRTGRINMILWDDNNNTVTYDVQSVVDVYKLNQMLHTLDPTADLKVVPYGPGFAVFGQAETNMKLEEIETAAKLFDKSAFSFVKVRDPKQILLEVRFAEIDRTAGKEFGFDGTINTRWWLNEIFTGQNVPVSTGNEDTITVDNARVGAVALPRGDQNLANFANHYASGSATIQTYLNWLETKSILKLIARPNLLAKDGEEASFVVGGEIPFITSNNNSTNVEYKEFGTQLVFTPTILPDGLVRLETRLQVSELDFNNTISLQGTSAPTIIKTEHSTIAEVYAGQSLVIGGLLSQRINSTDRKVPILGDIPLIQKAFRNETLSRKDVELIIVITPFIVTADKGTLRKTKYFPPQVVDAAVQAFHPTFPDEQADSLNLLLSQGEVHQNYEPHEYKRADRLVKNAATELLEMDRFAAFTGIKPSEFDIIKETEMNKQKPSFVDVIYESELAMRPEFSEGDAPSSSDSISGQESTNAFSSYYSAEKYAPMPPPKPSLERSMQEEAMPKNQEPRVNSNYSNEIVWESGVESSFAENDVEAQGSENWMQPSVNQNDLGNKSDLPSNGNGTSLNDEQQKPYEYFGRGSEVDSLEDLDALENIDSLLNNTLSQDSEDSEFSY